MALPPAGYFADLARTQDEMRAALEAQRTHIEEIELIPGPEGPAGPAGESAGRIYYFDPTQASDLEGFKRGLASPSPAAETTIARALSSSAEVLVEQFATDPGEPGVTDYPAGSAFRRYYVRVSGGSARLHMQAFVRTEAGVETLARDEYTAAFSNTTVALIEELRTNPAAGAMAITDRLVVRLYVQRMSGTNITATVHFCGSVNASHIQTTISAGATGPTGPQGETGPAGPGVAAGGTAGQVLTKASGADYDTEWVTPASGGGGSQVFTASGDFTVPDGVSVVYLTLVGGGGGGASGRVATSGFYGGGGGGGGGAILRYPLAVTPASVIAVTVGAGGAGGAAVSAGNGAAGSAGGASTFGTSVSAGGGSGAGIVQSGGCQGGAGGGPGGGTAAFNAAGGVGAASAYSIAGGGGGAGVTGQAGFSGAHGYVFAAGVAASVSGGLGAGGSGGASAYGPGGGSSAHHSSTGPVAGVSPTGYGGGGGGGTGLNLASGLGGAGGDGADGFVLVEW